MLFSSTIFLFLFLPIVIIGYFILQGRWRNVFLLIASFVFFAWGGVSYSAILLISIIINYFFGRWISKSLETNRSSVFLGIGISLNLIILGIFKYANFIIGNINLILESIQVPLIENKSIALPVGISFYTFQAISYLVDVYRKETMVQKNILRLGLYISLFPQLIAGPIVRYHDLAAQLEFRKVNFEKFSYGVKRFLLGLGKKVLIANNFAIIADEIFNSNPTELTSGAAWIGIIAYSFQIYFDFSGYSDMAIGLGSIFGFKIPENFNFPYIARSIKDFWRRWHISLSSWFRDYLYIPLGGNRMGLRRTYINLIIVFLLTGLWHGASWNFVVWGLIHGGFLIFERAGGEKILSKIWQPVQHFYTLFIVMMAWVLFRAEDFLHAGNYYIALVGKNPNPTYGYFEYGKFLTGEFYSILIIAILGAFGVFNTVGKRLSKLASNNLLLYKSMHVMYSIIQLMFYFGILIICASYLLSNTYNPFIYYRF